MPARRYQCQHCPAVMLVVPSETVPRRHYASTAIALALALYGVCRRSHAAVRLAVGSDEVVGIAAMRRWCTVARWIDAVTDGAVFATVPRMPAGLSRREIAQRAAMAIGAHAPPWLPESAPELRAFVGAAHMA